MKVPRRVTLRFLRFRNYQISRLLLDLSYKIAQPEIYGEYRYLYLTANTHFIRVRTSNLFGIYGPFKTSNLCRLLIILD